MLNATELTKLRRVGALAVAPCGTWAAVEVARLDADDAKYVTDLWRVPMDGGAPRPLTRGDHDDRAPAFRGDGALLFLSNRPLAKEEKPRAQVWALPDHGEATPLTDEPLGVSEFRVGGDRLVVLADRLPGVPEAAQRETAEARAKHGPSGRLFKQMPVRFWDHWVGEAAPHLFRIDADGRHDLTPDADRDYRETQWAISADGRWLAISRARMASDNVRDQRLQVIDVATGATRFLSDEPRVDYTAFVFDPAGERIACVRHQRQDGALGKAQLWLTDLDGDGRALATAWDRDPQPQCWLGDAVVAIADDGGQCPVVVVDPATDAVRRLTPVTVGGAHGNVRALPDGRLVGVRSRILHPPEVFACGADGAPRLLTALSGFSETDGAALAEVSELTAAGAFGDPVHSFFVRSKVATGPAPTFLWIHGGPISQHSDVWHWRWNALVPAAAGYHVALPNPRGSTGFGQAFVEGIWNNRWGAACYDDLMAVTDALAARDDVDAAKLIGMGGSFGGYMTNWIGGQTERFRCLVTHASLYNMSAFHGTTDEPGWFALELAGSPDADRDAFDRYSPERFLGAWRTPTLIIHGEKDYRVPIGEALALFEGLQRRGVESELLVFADENHWVLRPRNVRQWYEAFLAFAARYVG